MNKLSKSELIAAVLVIAITLVYPGVKLYSHIAAAQEAPIITPIPSTPENSICQDPYYQTSTDPNGPTICELKPGYTDCHNFTAVPAGQECTSGPQPYQEPVKQTEPVKPVTKCQEG